MFSVLNVSRVWTIWRKYTHQQQLTERWRFSAEKAEIHLHSYRNACSIRSPSGNSSGIQPAYSVKLRHWRIIHVQNLIDWNVNCKKKKTTDLDGKRQVLSSGFAFNCQLRVFHGRKIMSKHRYAFSARISLTLQYCLASSCEILLAITGLAFQVQ